jgi:hypothetical protein
MPKKGSVSRVDQPKLRELYLNVRAAGGGYKEFTAQAVEQFGIKHNTAGSAWYRWIKKGDAVPSSDSIVPKALQSNGMGLDGVSGAPEKVEIVAPDSVKVAPSVENEEGSGLRDIFGKMYAERDTAGASNKGVDSDDDVGGVPVTGAAPGSGFDATGSAPGAINIGKIFYTLGVAINNGLLWKERPIVKGSGEDTWIEQTSNDLNASFNPEDLKREDAPWINWAIAAFGIPALARVDLIPEKIKGAVEWFQNMRGPRQQKAKPDFDVGGQKAEEKKDEAPGDGVKRIFNIPETVWDGFSDGAKVWIADLASKGYKISPSYVHGPAIDDKAFRDIHVLRNQGDAYGNT